MTFCCGLVSVPVSDRRVKAPLLAEKRRRIMDYRFAMAEPCRIEGKAGEFALTGTTLLHAFKTEWITNTRYVQAHITRE